MKLSDGLELTIRPRGYGKSVQLIKESAKTGYHIITTSKEQIGYIEMKAREMGYDIPRVYSVNDFVGRRMILKEKNVLVDNLDCFLSKALDSYLGCHVVNATMSEQEEEY